MPVKRFAIPFKENKMIQVTIQRTEFRTHTFDIPDGIEEGSEEWDDIVNDYDWHNSSIDHANEEIISTVKV